MVKKESVKNRKIKRASLILIFAILLISLILTSFFLLQEGGIIKFEKELKEKNFSIEDKCSIIVGKIVHPIDREDECMNKCIAQCETYNLKYLKIEFELKTDKCNICNCYCS